jgi:hypothetical protein
MSTDLFSSPFAGPMLPADYIRLRREAAGLTIAQAARPFYKREDQRADVESNLRMFETPGVTVKPHIAETLSRAFPFDASVYRQLCEQAPSRHPRLCHGCGCDTHNFCTHRNGTICTITADRICTVCIEKVKADVIRRAA